MISSPTTYARSIRAESVLSAPARRSRRSSRFPRSVRSLYKAGPVSVDVLKRQ